MISALIFLLCFVLNVAHAELNESNLGMVCYKTKKYAANVPEDPYFHMIPLDGSRNSFRLDYESNTIIPLMKCNKITSSKIEDLVFECKDPDSQAVVFKTHIEQRPQMGEVDTYYMTVVVQTATPKGQPVIQKEGPCRIRQFTHEGKVVVDHHRLNLTCKGKEDHCTIDATISFDLTSYPLIRDQIQGYHSFSGGVTARVQMKNSSDATLLADDSFKFGPDWQTEPVSLKFILDEKGTPMYNFDESTYRAGAQQGSPGINFVLFPGGEVSMYYAPRPGSKSLLQCPTLRDRERHHTASLTCKKELIKN